MSFSIRDVSTSFCVFVAMIVAAAGFAAYILWPTALDIHNTQWLWGDLAQVYTAWGQFLNDPDTDWLRSTRMSYPLAMNFALFDSMPLFLLLSKPIAWLLPAQTQFHGWYFLLCMVAQTSLGYFAAKEALRLSNVEDPRWRTYLAAITGLLIGTLPFTFNRFVGHTALASHWVLILSIYAILKTIDWRRGTWSLVNCAVVVLAAGINPYLALMVVVSDIAVALAYVRERGWKDALLRALVLLFALAAGFVVFGFAEAADVQIIGYGDFSMNVLGPVDSLGLGQLLHFDFAKNGQRFEGFAYLGAGVLLLCTLSLVTLFIGKKMKSRFPFFAAVAVIVVFYLLALSTTIKLASYQWHLPVPQWLEYLLGRFRCSGRLFWISGIWIVIAAIAQCATRLSPRRFAIVLSILAIVQMADILPIAANARRTIESHTREQLNGIPAGNYSAIFVFPPWECSDPTTPMGWRNYESVGFFALQNNIPTNNFYAARTLAEQYQYHCNVENILTKIDPHAVYLLSESTYNEHRDVFSPKFACTRKESGNAFWQCLPSAEKSMQ